MLTSAFQEKKKGMQRNKKVLRKKTDQTQTDTDAKINRQQH